MTRKHFGTDGIRGRVGRAPMTPEFALKLGWAAGRVLGERPGTRVLVGKDTRRSGYLFESSLEAGFAAAGVETDLLGPLPTPGVAYLTRALRARAGVVISASHNPHEDNGFKFFGPDGRKLHDSVEREIEAMLEQPLECVDSGELGRARRIDDAQGRYIEFCKSAFPVSRTLNGLGLVIDCANGAAYRTAPAVFRELGADVTVIGDDPDGFNINRDCGSTHLSTLDDAVRSAGADLGIALDGDADRCLMVGHDGRHYDGDDLLWVIASQRRSAGALNGPVIGTAMTNVGLERAFAERDIDLERTAVGDRYVLERMLERGSSLGGETSGHVICLDRTTTGDGTVTALQVLAAMVESERPLADLSRGWMKFPQVLVNIRVDGSAKSLVEDPAVTRAEQSVRRTLKDRGRILLRPSGTEPLVRVMVEAEAQDEAGQLAESVADAVRSAAQRQGIATA